MSLKIFKLFKNFFNKSKSPLSDKESIFIHIPKCGGSSFVGLLMDSIKQQNFDPTNPTHKIGRVGSTKIMHVDFSSTDRLFKAPVIFNLNRNLKFKDILLYIFIFKEFPWNNCHHLEDTFNSYINNYNNTYWYNKLKNLDMKEDQVVVYSKIFNYCFNC